MVDDALHSTMFLLIQLLEVARQQVLPTLHSTMFLLIRYPGEPVQRKNGPLHSTMFLLIRNQGSYPGRKLQHFTFHNVSINTSDSGDKLFYLLPLHSTMFLLIRRENRCKAPYKILYIPQCFY